MRYSTSVERRKKIRKGQRLRRTLHANIVCSWIAIIIKSRLRNNEVFYGQDFFCFQLIPNVRYLTRRIRVRRTNSLVFNVCIRLARFNLIPFIFEKYYLLYCVRHIFTCIVISFSNISTHGVSTRARFRDYAQYFFG